MKEFQESIEKVIAGPERKSRVLSEEEKRIIAYHEAGHAVVAKVLPLSDTVQKVVSISRGMALGYTLIVPDEDRYMMSRAKFEDDLAGLLGGRAAEEIVFKDITTGASNDLERATKIARSMVTQYGMSKKLGPRTFGRKEELVFLGREISEQRNYSAEVAELIDSEVRCIIDRAHNRARNTVTDYRGTLDTLAQMLIQKESVDKAEFDALWAQVDVAPVTTEMVPAAGELAEVEGLRGYDAVHLAAAIAALKQWRFQPNALQPMTKVVPHRKVSYSPDDSLAMLPITFVIR